jgi:hypothetical protein
MRPHRHAKQVSRLEETPREPRGQSAWADAARSAGQAAARCLCGTVRNKRLRQF